MISDLAPEASRSSCFGFAQSMRKWGSAVGAVMVYFLMKASNNDYKLIFTMAATVSLASCLAFVVLVPSHVRPVQQGVGKDQKKRLLEGFSLAQFALDVASMGGEFYRMLLLVGLYCSTHINEVRNPKPCCLGRHPGASNEQILGD